MAGNNGGPWGGGGNGGGPRGGPNGSGGGGGRGPDQDPGQQIPEIDELMKKGQERLRGLMGGRGGPGAPNGGGGGAPSGGGLPSRGVILAAAAALVFAWGYASVYRVQNFEQSVELFLGDYLATRDEGLRFAPWPLVTREIIPVTREQTEDIGVGGRSGDDGLMLTGDENIVDIDFQVVWNINDPAKFLFNLREAQQTIRAVSESAMREIIAQSELSPILNRDRASISDRLLDLIQNTLDSYDSGVNIVRVNFDKADPPAQVIEEFRNVQSAEQERDRLEKEADAYANRIVAAARGESAQVLEDAEAYRARVVNEAEGEASRFSAVLTEYQKAPDVTRKRLYLETMERVLGRVDKVIIEDGAGGGSGVVPYLPLNELRKGSN